MQRPGQDGDPTVDGPRRVVRAFYAVTGLFTLSASLIWGINTLFLLDAGLTLFEAFAANSAFTAGQVLFEIPTGVVADTRGRRLSLLLCAGTLMAATFAYVLLAAYHAPLWAWLVASLLLGLGFTFYSGAVEAWFVDALHEASQQTDIDLDPYFARSNQVFAAGTVVGTLTGGLLGQWHLSAPYVLRIALLAALFAFAWHAVRDLGHTTRRFSWRRVPEEVAAVAVTSWRHGLSDRRVRPLMLITLLQMGFLIWGWYAWQPYFLDLLGRDLVWVAGVVAALMGLAIMAGNQLVHLARGRIGRPALLVAGAALLAAGMVGVGAAQSFWTAVAAFLAGMVGFGVAMPSKQAALHALIPSQERATIVSFDGLLGSAGGVGSQLALARLAERQGFSAAYLVGGAALSLAVPLALLFRRRVPRIAAYESS